MENMTEPSSSISYTASSPFPNGSMNDKVHASCGPENMSNLEIISLTKLSGNLEQLLCETGSDFSDADIIVEGVSVGVHRCVLAARSKFLDGLFRKYKGFVGLERRPKYIMENILPFGKIGYEAFLIFLSYLYTGKLKPFPAEVSTCVDNLCTHDACKPTVDFAVELMYASAIFQIPELVSLFQRRLHNLVGKAIADDVIPILIAAFHCQLSQLFNECAHRVARSDLEALSIVKELPSKVAVDIRLLRRKFLAEQGNNVPPLDLLHETRVKRIHKALDSDDVELVILLLTESHITLDEAYALHYAVAYCDPKIVSELLGLCMADVNLRNTRGNTVIHVAARRKEPSIIVSLLSKGASASDLTAEGQSAVSICRRVTRPKEYQMKREHGQEGNKYKLCIDVLEREMRRNPMAGNASISADDLRMKLLYLEDRVAFAKMFFPAEAKVVMHIARAETTSEISGLLSSSGNLVDLNEMPTSQNKMLLSRIETLSRIVELGRRHFPNCCQVLDKFMDNDLPDVEKGTPEEIRRRFVELKDEVYEAFNKDKARLHSCGVVTSSSSPACFKAQKL